MNQFWNCNCFILSLYYYKKVNEFQRQYPFILCSMPFITHLNTTLCLNHKTKHRLSLIGFLLLLDSCLQKCKKYAAV